MNTEQADSQGLEISVWGSVIDARVSTVILTIAKFVDGERSKCWHHNE